LKKNLKLTTINDTVLWALEFPDGHVDARWLYATRKELKQDAPGALYGDLSTWIRAKDEGCRAKRFFLSLTPTGHASVWAVVFPGGLIEARWMYPTKKELEKEAAIELYGDTSDWARAKREGHRARRLYLSLDKPEAQEATGPAKRTEKKSGAAKKVVRKMTAISDSEILDYLQKNASSITRINTRNWCFKGKKLRAGNSVVGSSVALSIRKAVKVAIEQNIK